MSDKFIKYNARQGGPFTSTQNLVDFELPSGHVFDLNDSYINLNCRLEVTQDPSSAAVGEGIYNFNTAWLQNDGSTNSGLKFKNVALVKNASMDCSAKGRIENIRRVDQLRQNLSLYTKSQKEDLDESWVDINQLRAPQGDRRTVGPFASLNKEGSVKSAYTDPTPIAISLPDIFEFCRVSEYDTSRAGQTRIHLELNRDRLGVDLQGPVTNVLAVDASSVVCQGVRPAAGSASGNNTITIGDNTGTESLKFRSIAQSPYYVGQMLKISATPTDPSGSAIVDQHALVNSIVHSDDGSIALTFTEAWGPSLSGTGFTYHDIAITEPDTATAVLHMDSCELVMKKVDAPQGIDTINYQTYSTEQGNGNSLQSFQQIFNVEPEASNMFMVFPQTDEDLLSVNDNIAEWRLRLNNEDLTDRAVVRDDPLDYDRLASTLNAMGMSLKNLNRNSGKARAATWNGTYTDALYDNIVIANPLFQTDRMKLLQVNIEAPAGNGVQPFTLFKQLPRVFEY